MTDIELLRQLKCLSKLHEICMSMRVMTHVLCIMHELQKSVKVHLLCALFRVLHTNHHKLIHEICLTMFKYANSIVCRAVTSYVNLLDLVLVSCTDEG